MDNIQLFQGDISIIKIEASQLPKGLEFKKTNEDTIVAYGEKSGHKHTLTVLDRSEVSYEIAKTENGFYVLTENTIELTHNQHKTQVLDKGIWFIGKQFEYDEIEKLKQVRD